MSPPARLTTRGLCKAYAAPVLRDIDLQIFRGEVHALVGANGAGKSTLARVICGLTPPDAGLTDPRATAQAAAASHAAASIVVLAGRRRGHGRDVPASTHDLGRARLGGRPRW